jgi:hypothetical protein
MRRILPPLILSLVLSSIGCKKEEPPTERKKPPSRLKKPDG